MGERLLVLKNYVLKTLRTTEEKWNIMIATDSYKIEILKFLNDPHEEKLLFSLNPSMLPIPGCKFSKNPSSKITFFIRRNLPSLLTPENILTVLLHGTLLNTEWTYLSKLLENVNLPLLQNKGNQIGWTPPIADYIAIEFQNLQNCITQRIGKLNNRTILFLPTLLDNILDIADHVIKGNNTKVSSLIRHSLDDIVAKWIDSIDQSTGLSAEKYIFKKEENPLPKTLIHFWEERLECLEYLINQMGDVRVKTVGYILESMNLSALHEHMICETMAAFIEARDINLYLSPLDHNVAHFENNDSIKTEDSLRPLLLTVELIWNNSKFCSSACNMSLIFITLHNMLINCAYLTIEPEKFFHGSLSESFEKLNSVIKYLNTYKNIYEKLKFEKKFISQDRAWNHENIFLRFDAFLERLYDVKQICTTRLNFSKLEIIITGELKSKPLNNSFQLIFQEYQNSYREWESIKFNAFDPDPKKTDFKNKKKQFDEIVESLKRRLVIPYDCLLKAFNAKLKSVTYSFLNFKNTFETKGVEAFSIVKYFPQLSGAIMWLDKLKHRIISMYDEFIFYDMQLYGNDSFTKILLEYRTLLENIQNLRTTILKQWQTSALSHIQRKASLNILGRKQDLQINDNLNLFVNFDNKLQTELKNAKSIFAFDGTVHSQLLKFLNMNDDFWTARVKLMRIVEWYNNIQENLNYYETDSFQEEWQEILNMLSVLLETEFWTTFRFENIDKCYYALRDLNKRLEHV